MDNLLEDHLQNSTYNMLGIQAALVYEINYFVTQFLTGKDISGLFIVCRTRKHLKVAFESENMKSTVLSGARSSKRARTFLYK